MATGDINHGTEAIQIEIIVLCIMLLIKQMNHKCEFICPFQGLNDLFWISVFVQQAAN